MRSQLDQPATASYVDGHQSFAAHYVPGPYRYVLGPREQEISLDVLLASVEPGWHLLILRLLCRLRVLGLKPVVQQVKEKFGSLCFYCYFPDVPDSLRDIAEELVGAAERESHRTCESCGDWGVRRGPGWYRTLCAACAIERQPPYNLTAYEVSEFRRNPTALESRNISPEELARRLDSLELSFPTRLVEDD